MTEVTSIDMHDTNLSLVPLIAIPMSRARLLSLGAVYFVQCATYDQLFPPQQKILHETHDVISHTGIAFLVHTIAIVV